MIFSHLISPLSFDLSFDISSVFSFVFSPYPCFLYFFDPFIFATNTFIISTSYANSSSGPYHPSYSLLLYGHLNILLSYPKVNLSLYAPLLHLSSLLSLILLSFIFLYYSSLFLILYLLSLHSIIRYIINISCISDNFTVFSQIFADII